MTDADQPYEDDAELETDFIDLDHEDPGTDEIDVGERPPTSETDLIDRPPTALDPLPAPAEPPPEPADHMDLIDAARRQARQRAAPLLGGLGIGASIPGYQIQREIHRGGQGVVYLAQQEGTTRQVAIKVVRDGPFTGAHERARFEREVRVLAQIRNPNIVAIHDSGAISGAFYYVMDYVPGSSLDEYVQTNSLGIREIIGLFITIASAVNSAHLRGVIHRDLKPSNIRVTPAGSPQILDFGLAKVTESGTDESIPTQMTVTGQFVGSLPWSSPEQVGADSSKIDVRTDVYALGVMIHQMIAGDFPYPVEGPMRMVMDHIAQTNPAPLRKIRKDVARDLEMIVLMALSKRAEDRYQTAGELARDLERFLAGDPVEARRDAQYLAQKLVARRWPVVLGVGLAVLILILAAGVLGYRLGAASTPSNSASNSGSGAVSGSSR